MDRRLFLTLCGAMVVRPGEALAADAGRSLDFRIEGDFGGAAERDIRAVLGSTAATFWGNCRATRWELPGFFIYRSRSHPIVNHEHREDGRIAVGLNVSGTFWAQFAFQFAHEFCHALAGHSNDWRRLRIKGPRPNQWFEESLCETASLFALRAMETRWRMAPPYPGWVSYAPSLGTYAKDRIAELGSNFDRPFADWFAKQEMSLRSDCWQRRKNLNIARRLLPVFEAEPTGWEAVTSCNLGEQDGGTTLPGYFREWIKNSPADKQPFIRKLAAVFDVKEV